MTEDNRRKNIAAEVRRGDESLESAELLLHRDLVREGGLDADVARVFSRLQKFRQDADYTAEFVFTPAGAAEEVAGARTFVAEARGRLRAGGWLA